MLDSLLEALDLAFDRYLAVKPPSRNGIRDSLRALRIIDELVDTNSSGPIYSAEIAAKLKVSVRTLNNLTQKSDGMSLHRYIRLGQLWAVRRQLLAGGPRQQIKQIALTNGFWHLGDFAAKYAAQFGELPSSTQTLAQSRG